MYKKSIVLKKCPTCFCEFESRKCNKRKFCSSKCFYAYNIGEHHVNYGKKIPKEEHGSWKGGLLKKSCKFCGKQYEVKQHCHKQKFCSAECYCKSKNIIKSCPQCGDAFKTNQHRYRKFCSKECAIRSQSGERSHFWKGGIYPLREAVRKISSYKEWRKRVYQRDSYICQICNKNSSKLHVDHIIPYSFIFEKNNIVSLEDALLCEELWDINNGRTLCAKCHRETKTYGRWFLKEKNDK